MSQDDDGNQSGEVLLSPSLSDSSTCPSNEDDSDSYSSVSMGEDRPLVNEDRGIVEETQDDEFVGGTQLDPKPSGITRDVDLLAIPLSSSLGAKPKQLSKTGLPGTVNHPKRKPCKATGKGQKCSDREWKGILNRANENINGLRDIAEQSNAAHREHHDYAKQKLIDHSSRFKKLGKLNNDLEVKLSRKSRLLEQEKIESKDNKDRLRKEKVIVRNLERQLKQKEEVLQKKEKEEAQKSRKIDKLKDELSQKKKAMALLERDARQLNSDLVSWKRKAEKLAEDFQSKQQKARDVTTKPSTNEQLYIKEKDLEMKHRFKVKNAIHAQEMKQQAEEDKMRLKTQRYDMCIGSGSGNGGNWSTSSVRDDMVRLCVNTQCYCV